MIEPNHAEIIKIKHYLDNNVETKFQQFKDFVEMLLEENNNHNLISKNTIKNIWSRHVLDSLQLLPYIEKNDENIIDLGSGGGFPAIILSISTKKRFFLLEKSPVKALFLKKVINKLKLNAIVINKIITKENIDLPKGNTNVITARAFKSVKEILNIAEAYNIKKIILLKGINYEKEINDAKEIIKKWDFKITKSILDEGVILIMKNNI